MDEDRRSLVQNWLTKAQHDLAAARKLAGGPDPYLDTAVYHCQQAAEKCLKGFLVFHDHRIQKTHDIRFLLHEALPFEAGFSAWMEAAELLTPFATAYRYPGEFLEPEPEEFRQAILAAKGLLAFVLSLMPPEVRP